MEPIKEKFTDLEVQNQKVFKSIIELLKAYKEVGMSGKMNIYDLLDNLIQMLEKWA